MVLKKMMKKLTTPMSQLDEEKLREFCAGHAHCSTIGQAQPRQQVTLVGEIKTLRIVPRAGSPSLEATITDGTGSLVAVWTGRRRIAGVAPGKRLIVHGRASANGPTGRLFIYNPRYELL